MKSARPKLPADIDEPGADMVTLLTSGLTALLDVPAPSDILLLDLPKAIPPERLWYFFCIVTKVGGFDTTLR